MLKFDQWFLWHSNNTIAIIQLFPLDWSEMQKKYLVEVNANSPSKCSSKLVIYISSHFAVDQLDKTCIIHVTNAICWRTQTGLHDFLISRISPLSGSPSTRCTTLQVLFISILNLFSSIIVFWSRLWDWCKWIKMCVIGVVALAN